MDTALNLAAAKLVHLSSVDKSVAGYKVAGIATLKKLEELSYDTSVPPLTGTLVSA